MNEQNNKISTGWKSCDWLQETSRCLIQVPDWLYLNELDIPMRGGPNSIPVALALIAQLSAWLRYSLIMSLRTWAVMNEFNPPNVRPYTEWTANQALEVWAMGMRAITMTKMIICSWRKNSDDVGTHFRGTDQRKVPANEDAPTTTSPRTGDVHDTFLVAVSVTWN